jgi:hypothetical protein
MRQMGRDVPEPTSLRPTREPELFSYSYFARIGVPEPVLG